MTPPRRPLLRSTLAVLALLATATGCAGVAGPADAPGGDRLPVRQPGEVYGHESESVDGVLLLAADGCWSVEIDTTSLLVVFPQGWSRPPDDGSVMVSAEGVHRVADGTPVEAMGGVVPVVALPGFPDGFWGGYLAFCDPDAEEVVILDSIRPVAEGG